MCIPGNGRADNAGRKNAYFIMCDTRCGMLGVGYLQQLTSFPAPTCPLLPVLASTGGLTLQVISYLLSDEVTSLWTSAGFVPLSSTIRQQ
jgi:hypothetical protein